jgi:hypothetical protein
MWLKLPKDLRVGCQEKRFVLSIECGILYYFFHFFIVTFCSWFYVMQSLMWLLGFDVEVFESFFENCVRMWMKIVLHLKTSSSLVLVHKRLRIEPH